MELPMDRVVYYRLEDMHKKWISSQEKHDAEISELKAMVTALSHLLETKAATAQGRDASAFDSSRQETPAWQSPPLNDLDECKVARDALTVVNEPSHQVAHHVFEKMSESQKCTAKELCVDYNGEDSFEIASWIKVDLEPPKYVEGSETSTNDDDGLISEELKIGGALKQHLTARQVLDKMPRMFFSGELIFLDEIEHIWLILSVSYGLLLLVLNLRMWYVLSKTPAVEAAWTVAKEKGIDMVTINPAMVIGPLLAPTLNTSAVAVLNLINAFETQCANGRYFLVESVAQFSEVVGILRELYPNLSLPDKCADDKPLVPRYQVSKEKTQA